VIGTTGERVHFQEGLEELIARSAAHAGVPVAVGFGISTPAQADVAARAGADGVIVGTRLVRAAAEADDAPAAVRALVAEFASALC
jgi:tryptophan synthase alpha chain